MLRCALLMLAFLPALAFADVTLPGRQQSRLTLLAAEEVPGCTQATDCKGGRLCVAGSCQTPEYAAPAAPQSTPSSALSLHLSALKEELKRLEQSRPSMGWPIFMAVLGTVGAHAALAILGFSMLASGAGAALGLVVAAGSLILLAVGIVAWAMNGARNQSINARIVKLREQHADVDRSSAVQPTPRLLELARF